VKAWVATRNAGAAKLNWTFRVADARKKLAHLYPQTPQRWGTRAVALRFNSTAGRGSGQELATRFEVSRSTADTLLWSGLDAIRERLVPPTGNGLPASDSIKSRPFGGFAVVTALTSTGETPGDAARFVGRLRSGRADSAGRRLGRFRRRQDLVDALPADA
jgi:hypothetical protein